MTNKSSILLDCLCFNLVHRILAIISILCPPPPPYYLEPFIHSVAFLSLSIYPFLLMSTMNINYGFIYKNSPLTAFEFSLPCLSSSLCLFRFPIISYEAKSMRPLCSFYLPTSSPGSCLSFHFAFNYFFLFVSELFWSNLSLYTGSI